MLDIRRFRYEPEVLRHALARRGDEAAVAAVDEVRQLDEERRDAIGEANELKARRNEESKRIGELKRAGENADELIAEMRAVGERIDELDEVVGTREAAMDELLLRIPNLPMEDVPEGGEEANRILSTSGDAPDFAFTPRPHWELGEALGILDLPGGARVSGSGFPVLRGAGARLQRALIDFFLEVHTREHGYEEARVPYLVTRESLEGTGQLPKFADESYQSERDDLWLIPTAEVPLTNLLRDELLEREVLPVAFTAYSPCFRREAGAAGKDTRGLLRVHQFDKVELVRFERPERSPEALEELTRHAEVLLERLGLRWRRVLLATGDLGFSGARTYDLEVWAPGVEQWLEVSSCTTFTDYQARRSNIRFRPAPGEKPEFVHTLNGSGLALPRIVAALLETGQEEDGSVVLPDALEPWMGREGLRLAPPG
jgi:seryl-tRNA synthetase